MPTRFPRCIRCQSSLVYRNDDGELDCAACGHRWGGPQRASLDMLPPRARQIAMELVEA